MTSIEFRPPYTKDELDKLYPKELELRLVQVLLRHGERAPVSARFGNVSPVTSSDRCPLLMDYRGLGRSPGVLALLQCCAATALGRHDT